VRDEMGQVLNNKKPLSPGMPRRNPFKLTMETSETF